MYLCIYAYVLMYNTVGMCEWYMYIYSRASSFMYKYTCYVRVLIHTMYVRIYIYACFCIYMYVYGACI